MPEIVLWHSLSPERVLKQVRSSFQGLKSKDIQKRFLEEGPNELQKEKQDGWWVILIRQFFNPLIFVLVIAAIVSGILGDFVDLGVILAAVAVNTLIGFVQEYKASRALIQLQSFIEPKTLVRRDGKEMEILAREVVVGDVLILQTGDQVSADARLFDISELQTNEAPLTGESLPISKQTEQIHKGMILAERSNMVFAGTTIVGGHGVGIVVATGTHTELGKIAALISKTPDTKTPLQNQLAHLARWIGIIVVTLVVLLFVIGVVAGLGVFEMFEMSVALAVAAIPEGLTISVTIVLAIGMQRILRRRALVRRLVAAETLGSVSIICSDKTGTLTEGNMRVVSVLTLEEKIESTSFVDLRHQGVVKHILEAFVLCNDAKQAEGAQGLIIRGSATERALFESAIASGLDPEALRTDFPLVTEIPFDSVHKYHLTERRSDGVWKLTLIGSPERILSACRLTPAQQKKIHLQEQNWAKDGLRLVMVAEKIIRKQKDHLSDQDLVGFRFLGLVAMQDPLRSDVAEQIVAARNAGIRTIIVTGDHPQTAQTIARQAGLSVHPSQVVLGLELDDWSDEELERRVSRVGIFARVEPRHKIRIIQAWQQRGEVVAMTGDGVNDAPALKAADVGIALGSGTEVAKQASDLVLLDNNFATITAAIEQGRVIFDNIRKSTVYLMAGSFTEIILIAGSILLGLPLPLLPAQILWINLFADSFPNIGLTFEPGEKDVMKLSPRPRNESVINAEMMSIIFMIGGVTIVTLFSLYIWLLKTIPDFGQVRSIMFAAVGIYSLLYIFVVKSFRSSLFRTNPFSNLWLVGGVAIGFVLMIVALLHPFFQMIFEITPLRLSDLGLLLMIGAIQLVIIALVKEWYLFTKSKKVSL